MIRDTEFALDFADIRAKAGGIDGIALGGFQIGNPAAEEFVEGDQRGFADVLADHGGNGDGEMFFAADLKAEFGLPDAVSTTGGGFLAADDEFVARDFTDEFVVAISSAVFITDDEAAIIGVWIPEVANETKREFREDDAFISVFFHESVVASRGDYFGADAFQADAGFVATVAPASGNSLDFFGVRFDGDGLGLFDVPGFGDELVSSRGREERPERFQIMRAVIQ